MTCGLVGYSMTGIQNVDGICLGCDVVQKMAASVASAKCACGGNILPLLSLDAFRIGRLAHRLGTGYYVHSAILDVVSNLDQSKPIDYRNSRDVFRKDGTKHTFAFDHYLREAVVNSQTKDDLDRVWIAGALITLGDALGHNKYFDRAPHLELVRHLRNGIAHGNRFRIDDPGRLAKYPANNFQVKFKSPATFEITSAVQGQAVLFDFVGPADCVDLFMSVEVHLFSLALKN
jgi:hypothetical protein